MNDPQLVCHGCGKPTTMFKPVCDDCLRDAGVEPINCVLCLNGSEPKNGLHYTATGGYMGKCLALENRECSS